jgi:superkiller protein 3
MYQKVIAVDPGNAASVFYNLGVHAWNENKDKEAAQAFKKAIEIDPKYAPAHKELARTLTKLQDFEGAVQHYQEYLKLNPQAPDAKEIRDTIALLKG